MRGGGTDATLGERFRRDRLPAGAWRLGSAAGLILLTVGWWLWPGNEPPGKADPADAVQVALGQSVYAARCAGCHGERLEGQPDWPERRADGRLPAPPHDATGHTWHHPDPVLFGIIKYGLRPPYAPEGYASDMPAFGGILSDAEIWAVLAFLKSRWPEDARVWQETVTRQDAERAE